MSQRLIASYFLPQRATEHSEDIINKEIKRPLQEDDDDVCQPAKKSKKAIIESDDENVITTSCPDEKGLDANNTNSDDIVMSSSSKVKDGACSEIALRKTAPRKTYKAKRKNIAENASFDKLFQDSKTEDVKQLKVDGVEDEKKDSIKEPEKPIHGFFAPRTTSLNNKKESSPVKIEQATPTAIDVVSKETKNGSHNGLLYDPACDDYDPVKNACWGEGQRVPYIALARTLEEIEKVSARLKSIEILSNFLCSVIALTPSDLVPCVYLCLNKLAPAYEGIELGIGDTLLMKAIAQATGRSLNKIKLDVEEKGDLGIVAETSRSTQKTMFSSCELAVTSVFKNFKEISLMSGHSSMSKKTDKIKSMFVSCRGPEARFLIRSLSGKLRIGMAEQSILQAIAQAFVLGRSSNRKKLLSDPVKKKKEVDAATLIIKTTYCECPNYDKIIPLLLDHPLEELPQHCKIEPGIPLKPMLAHPTKGIHEVMAKFGKSDFICEFKYDGERAQIHILERGDIQIYSRNQENNTSKYPDVSARLATSINPDKTVTSAIIDAEAVAWDPENKQILPFQVLSTRKRKDASSKDIKVQVCIYAFDLLYLNGESLVKQNLRQRKELLQEMFLPVEGEFMFAKSMVSNETEDVEEFLDESIKSSCEGLMVKTLDEDATYEIAKRSHNWLKLKKDYLDGVGDTIDLVVIGGYHGKGKRTGKYGGFLLACYDTENEEYQAICKIGTGISDTDLEKHSEFFKGHILDTPKTYYRFDESHCPDKWFDSVQVWEVKAADLSLSPIYKAALGMVDPERGISLRFPRFVRIRDDKKPEEATDSTQIASMYKSQDQIISQMKNNKPNEEDFY